MSYARMDHANWVELQAAASKKRLSAKEKRSETGWAHAPEKLSGFQAKAFDILGIVFGGIYNAPIVWTSVDWRAGRGLAIPIRYGTLATYDFQELTTLVFLCHEARIRADISSYGPKGLMILLHPRKATGGVSQRHPNLDEAIKAFREYIPADHRIFYREEETKAQAIAEAAS